jgi:hypothetical protein
MTPIGWTRKDQVAIWFLLLIFHILQDSTFEFERRRNRPERYDRNVTENTLKAIKTIDKVRSRREAKHIETR